MHTMNILFLSEGRHHLAPLAKALFQRHGIQGIQSNSAVLQVKPLSEAQFGQLSPWDLSLNELEPVAFDPASPTLTDMVITLDDASHALARKALPHLADSNRPVLPQPEPLAHMPETAESAALILGAPNHIHWNLGHEGESVDAEPGFPDLVESLNTHISHLIHDGYLQGMLDQRRFLHGFLDSLAEGVILHDTQRRIFLFNKAAERITGYSRDEVLGQDCHNVFHQGFCGSLCAFQNGAPKQLARPRYQVTFRNKSGEDKRLGMRVTPLIGMGSVPLGVIAAIQDETEVSELRWQLKERHSFHGMVGYSPKMLEVFETIRQVTDSDYPVLVTGESGTGKELVANAIHQESRRKAHPFVPINCGALPETILESELFGHVRGAFTGAIRDKKGRFELADKGTLFLDEVGELTPLFQVRLLRVLQEKRFERVGGEQPIHVDVRIISATNRDLRQMVREGDFREDLYYRLCVVPIHLPPLRERLEDLHLLVARLLETIREETGKPTVNLADDTMDMLMRYTWPGNIRELINTLQYGTVRCQGELILPTHLPPEVRGENGLVPVMEPSRDAVLPPANGCSSRRGKLTEDQVRRALVQSGGNKVEAAKLLHVGRATLYRFLKDHPVEA